MTGQTQGSSSTEAIRKRKDGTEFPGFLTLTFVRAEGTKGTIIAQLTDLTPRRAQEASVLDSQRIETIGLLAGGLAHDLNNLLAGIFSHIELAAMSLKANNTQTAVGYLERAHRVVDRAKRLDSQLLTFNRGGGPIVSRTIIAENRESGGARIVISLPLTGRALKKVSSEPLSAASGHRRVLIVDDDPDAREALAESLRVLGYSPYSFGGFAEALESAQREGPVEDVPEMAFLDLTLPGSQGGQELSRVLRKLWPATPFLAISGYSDNPVLSNPQAWGFSASIAKPFTVEGLQRTIDAVRSHQD